MLTHDTRNDVHCARVGPGALVAVCGAVVGLLATAPAHAQQSETREAGSTRLREMLAAPLGQVPVLRAVKGGRGPLPPGGGVFVDGCNNTSDYTAFNWGSPIGANVSAQAGFAQQEIQAVSYQLTAADFPLKVNTVETLFAGNTSVQTTTEWSVLVWDGPPNTGTLVAEYSSDGTILPHLVLQPGSGTAGIIQFAIDPQDPEQIIVNGTSGTNILSIGFRIDRHNNQTANACITAPPSASNVFPTTDRDGLAQPSRNWLNGLNCGSFGCPPNGGWATFGQLNVLCRPTGDWVMRATWNPINCAPGIGACCLPNGTCQVLAVATCQQQGGVYRGDGTDCSTANCPSPTGACCFGSGGCLILTSADCTTAGGVFQGNGTACGAGGTCPQGACCLPSGSCIITTSSGCTSLSGVFRGVGTACASANCPQPSGACCFSTGGCLNLTAANCTTASGFFQGPGTSCSTTNCSTALCYPNCDASTIAPVLNALDFSCFLTRYVAGDTYANCDGSTIAPALNALDFSCFLVRYRNGCP